MNKEAVKDMMFGGLHELIRNRKFYYYSSVGSQFSHWTDDGKQAVLEYMELMARKMREAEEVELNERAKEMTFSALKSE